MYPVSICPICKKNTLRKSSNNNFIAGYPSSDLCFNDIKDGCGRLLHPLDVCLHLEVVQRFDIEPGGHSEAHVQRDGDYWCSGTYYLT